MRKTVYFQYSKFQKGITPTKIDENWRHSKLFCRTVNKVIFKISARNVKAWQSHIQNFSSKCQSMKEKSAETAHYLHSKFIKRHNSSKLTQKWRHSNLICSTLKQSHVQNFSSICQSMYEKSAENGRTETRTESRKNGRRVGRDGHHHTIIRPVWRPSDGRIKNNKNWRKLTTVELDL